MFSSAKLDENFDCKRFNIELGQMKCEGSTGATNDDDKYLQKLREQKRWHSAAHTVITDPEEETGNILLSGRI